MKQAIWLTFISFIIFCFAGCVRPTESKSSIKVPKQLRWATPEAPKSADWTLSTSRSALQHAALVMEGLTESYDDNGILKVRSALSQRWEYETPSRLVFYLRPKQLWSDGKELTAADFVFAWKRLLSHASQTPFGSLLYSIKNARKFSEGQETFEHVGISSPSPLTLRLDLESSDPKLLLLLAHPATFPAREDATPASFFSPTLGPFFLERAVSGKPFLYKKNPKYQRTPVELDSIEWQVFASEEARVQLFLNGEADLADFFPNEVPPQIGNPQSSFFQPTRTWIGLLFNTSRKPFQNIVARKAFHQSIQREEPINLLKTHDLPAFGFEGLWTNSPLVEAPSWSLKYSPVSAKANFQNSLQEDSVVSKSSPRPPQSFTLSYDEFPHAKEVAEDLQAQWLKNLDLKVEIQEGGAAGNSNLFLTILTVNPYFIGSGIDSFVAGSAKSVTHWHNDAFKSLWDNVATNEDFHELRNALNQAEEIVIAKEAVAMPLYFQTRPVLKRPEVQNLVETPVEIWNFRDTTIR